MTETNPANANRSPQRRLSRRNLARLAAGTAMATGVAHVAGSDVMAQATPASPVAGTPAAATDPFQITLPDAKVQLPTDNITFRWVDSGDSKVLFFRKYFETFTQAHPNIAFDYLGLPWTEIAQVVPLGVRNGNAPDVFQVPQEIPVAQAVREGWVRPIDDLIPDFAEWQSAFPPLSFVEGVNVFNGRTYTFPRSTSRRAAIINYFNRPYMTAAGYDPETTPLTWDTLRDAARKITDAGAGNYYGVILAGKQVGRWGGYVQFMGRLSGSSAGSDSIDYRTGEYAYMSDGYLAAIELLLALREDGVVFPGSMSLNDPQARAQMPQGVAGMIFEGEFTLPIWARDNPDFDFGVSLIPTQSDTVTPMGYQNTGTNHQWVYAKSKYPEVAAEIFRYLGTKEGQTAFVNITGGSDPSIFSDVNDNAAVDPRMRTVYAIYEKNMKLCPDVRIRNPETSQVYLNMTPPAPSFGEVVQGIYTGQLDDPKAAMQDLKDRSERALDEAIAAAQADGAAVSRDDYVFPNWDPTRDYLEADYAALG